MNTNTSPCGNHEPVQRSGFWSSAAIRNAAGSFTNNGSDPSGPMENTCLNGLRQELRRQAGLQLPITYEVLANNAAFSSVGMIRKALEILMEEDAVEKRPFIAAIAVSNFRTGLPASGFFSKAMELGSFSGGSDNVEAFTFHASELFRANQFYGRTPRKSGPGSRCKRSILAGASG